MERALIDKAIQPTEVNLQEVLKDSYKYYRSLINMASGFDKKWTFYKGWSQKVFVKSKALFYLAPHDHSFLVSMAIREKEKEEFMRNTKLSYLHDRLNESTKYNEGYGLQFIVEDEQTFKECETFIEILINERKLT